MGKCQSERLPTLQNNFPPKAAPFYSWSMRSTTRPYPDLRLIWARQWDQSLLIETHTGTPLVLKKLPTSAFTLTTSTGRTESNFQKRGYQRSRNTTGDRYVSEPLREQLQIGPLRKHLFTGTMRIKTHQSKSTIVIHLVKVVSVKLFSRNKSPRNSEVLALVWWNLFPFTFPLT